MCVFLYCVINAKIWKICISQWTYKWAIHEVTKLCKGQNPLKWKINQDILMHQDAKIALIWFWIPHCNKVYETTTCSVLTSYKIIINCLKRFFHFLITYLCEDRFPSCALTKIIHHHWLNEEASMRMHSSKNLQKYKTLHFTIP